MNVLQLNWILAMPSGLPLGCNVSKGTFSSPYLRHK